MGRLIVCRVARQFARGIGNRITGFGYVDSGVGERLQDACSASVIEACQRLGRLGSVRPQPIQSFPLIGGQVF